MDDKGVIYIPAPETRGMGGSNLELFVPSYSMYKLATMGITGEPMAAPSTLFIELALEREVGVLETELQ